MTLSLSEINELFRTSVSRVIECQRKCQVEEDWDSHTMSFELSVPKTGWRSRREVDMIDIRQYYSQAAFVWLQGQIMAEEYKKAINEQTSKSVCTS